MSDARGEPLRQGNQNADGKPHMTYYNREHHLSFVWDGLSRVIDVCVGGYAEPVYFEIPVTAALGVPDFPAQTLFDFASLCELWVKGHTTLIPEL